VTVSESTETEKHSTSDVFFVRTSYIFNRTIYIFNAESDVNFRPAVAAVVVAFVVFV